MKGKRLRVAGGSDDIITSIEEDLGHGMAEASTCSCNEANARHDGGVGWCKGMGVVGQIKYNGAEPGNQRPSRTVVVLISLASA